MVLSATVVVRRDTEQMKKTIIFYFVVGSIADYLIDETSGERKRMACVDSMSRIMSKSHC